jgi:2-oxoglutarate ferredoxin oxidoreductase subunit gamma
MQEEMIIAGFGGQGVIMAGKLLCIAAMNEGKYVSHIPSYGAEMRGGTANCSVVISDKEIGSPTVPKPSIVIVMNTPSLTKFESKVQAGGLLIYNSSLIDRKPVRTDITVVDCKANDISESEGSTRAANMAVIGKLLALKPEISSLDSVIKALDVAVSVRNRKFNDANIKVLKAAFS